MNYEEVLTKTVSNNLVRIVFSKPNKDSEMSGAKVRPVKIKDELFFQITKSVGSKDTNTKREVHENVPFRNAVKELMKYIPGFFMQALIETETEGYTVLSNKKGTVTVIKNKTTSGVKAAPMEHNRAKNYLIEEGENVPFLIDLGVMTKEGKIVASKYDKFRQINRYLEFVEDICDKLKSDKPIRIIDFGCGKSYLTFALYYYLTVKKHFDVKITGLDLKPDVIETCNKLKNKYKYNNLSFEVGDIGNYEGTDSVDMVITLHACDTATDYALYKAIKWGAKVIMAVPCCQHELNKVIDVKSIAAVTQYGILKDRISAIFTDSIRANILKEYGYDTQILEFIDMEHTPKNLMIRATKNSKPVLAKSEMDKAHELEEFVGAKLTLRKLLLEEDK